MSLVVNDQNQKYWSKITLKTTGHNLNYRWHQWLKLKLYLVVKGKEENWWSMIKLKGKYI